MKRRMRFVTWAKKDPTDERPILYTVHMKEWNGEEHTEHFTSDEEVTYSTLERIRQAWIQSIELIGDTWKVVLYED